MVEEKKSYHVVYLDDGKLSAESSDSIRDIVEMLLEIRPAQYSVFWGVRCDSLTRLFVSEVRADLQIETLAKLAAFEQGLDTAEKDEEQNVPKKRKRKRRRKSTAKEQENDGEGAQG